MTTTVYDMVARLVATDTRWSARLDGIQPNLLVYVDQTDFAKLAVNFNCVLVLAGDGPLISLWKKWWFAGADLSATPPYELTTDRSVALLIVSIANNEVVTNKGNFLMNFCETSNKMLSLFSGSGAKFAANYWRGHPCAWSSIFHASENDPCTSEAYNHVDFETGKSNIIKNCSEYTTILNTILERGMVMETTNRSVTKISEHPKKTEIAQLFTSGSVVASAPTFRSNGFNWSQSDKTEFENAIRKIKAEHASA